MSETTPPYGGLVRPTESRSLVIPFDVLRAIDMLVLAESLVSVKLDFKDAKLIEVRREEFERLWRRGGGPTFYAQQLFSDRVGTT